METNTNDPIDQFLNQVLDEKKISGETPEVRKQLVEDLRTQLMQQIDRAMINALDSEHLDKLSKALDQGIMSDLDMQNFFVQAGVDGERVALETMMRFREYYLGRQ